MNQLNVSLQHLITTLAAKGWSSRKIARELGINRQTVRRYREIEDSRPAIAPTGSKAGRTSHCAPWAAVIEEGLLAGLSAQRIYWDLLEDQEFTGGYDSVKRFVRRLSLRVEPPFRRMECAPGQELQVDFGLGAWVMEEGRRRRPHLFRAVLSHSRKAYSEAVWRQTSESFIRSLENGFRYFGGVTATVVIDNLKAGVLQADWYDPKLNPKLEEFARHYGTVILPTKPAMPRHKGKVESGVKETRLLRLYNTRREQIALHALAEAGKFTTDPAHLHSRKRHIIERGADYLLESCGMIGPLTGAWAQAMHQTRGPQSLRVMQGLLQLAEKHPADQLEKAARLATHHGAWRLGDLKRLLALPGKVVQMDFLEIHPLIRSLEAYRIEPAENPNPNQNP